MRRRGGLGSVGGVVALVRGHVATRIEVIVHIISAYGVHTWTSEPFCWQRRLYILGGKQLRQKTNNYKAP